jgi:hypothetical protein
MEIPSRVPLISLVLVFNALRVPCLPDGGLEVVVPILILLHHPVLAVPGVVEVRETFDTPPEIIHA